MIPGGAPFSQLSSGVKDAMVVFTRLLKCHFMTKTCKKAVRNNTQAKQKRVRQRTVHIETAEEGSGDVRKTTPMPERKLQHREKMALVKPSGSTYARASMQVTKG